MNMKIFTQEFLQYFLSLNKKFTNKFRNNGYSKNTEAVYATLKLGEEFGELSEAVLSLARHQRKEKINEHNMEELRLEIADVLIQTLVIADILDVDVEKSLLIKFKKLENRADKF